jgi:uridine kinase
MHLIGIAGPSGAGKTELARALARLLDAPVLALDCYYRDLADLSFEERAAFNFDSPEAIEQELLFEHLRRLVAGGAIDVPVYDFTAHRRTVRTEPLGGSEFILFEGLWVLHWEEVRRLLGSSVYVDAPDEVCFERRMARDRIERGRSAESVLAQYTATVRPGARQYILPTRRWAGLVVSGTDPLEQTVAAVRRHIAR